MARLRVNDRQILKLLRSNPFSESPPAQVRCRFERYRFTSRVERHETGQWWVRTPIAEYLQPLSLNSFEALADAQSDIWA